MSDLSCIYIHCSTKVEICLEATASDQEAALYTIPLSLFTEWKIWLSEKFTTQTYLTSPTAMLLYTYTTVFYKEILASGDLLGEKEHYYPCPGISPSNSLAQIQVDPCRQIRPRKGARIWHVPLPKPCSPRPNPPSSPLPSNPLHRLTYPSRWPALLHWTQEATPSTSSP